MKEHPFTKEIIADFFEDNLPEIQRTQVLNWLSSLPEEEQLAFMEFHLSALDKLVTAQQTSSVSNFQIIEDQILARERSRKKFKFQSLAIAASLLPLLMIYFFSQQPTVIRQNVKATKTASANKIIRKYNQLNITQILRLPDSSEVSLYPGAALDYTIAFNGKKREVKLSGKAFFKIKHDQNRPFTVQTGAITTVVLGTSFWVDAKAGSKLISVKVKTGKVGVVHGNQPAIFLLPSERAEFNLLSGVLAKVTKPLHKIGAPVKIPLLPTALVFNKTPLKQVATVLTENFGIQIDMEDLIDASLPVSMNTKGKTITAVLEEIKLQIPIDYEIKDKHITIRKKE